MCDECYISSSPEDKYHKETRRHKITKGLHCRDHPSLVHSGRVQWLLNGEYHREGNLPSYIAYHNNGKISVLHYEVNDAPTGWMERQFKALMKVGI